MAKKKLKTTKNVVRFLRVSLTRDELLVAGKSQADKLLEAALIEADRKRIADDFKAKSSALDAEAASLATKISTGYEFRNVACTVHLGVPDAEHKQVVRDDLGEIVAVEEMTESDKQLEIPLAEGGAS